MSFRHRRTVAVSAALALFSAVIVTSARPAAAACGDVVIWNTDNQKYVTAERDYTPSKFKGELRARTATPGPWEKFTLCWIDGWTFTLKAKANGLYVSVEEDYEEPYRYMLRARADAVGAWEKLTIFEPGGDVVGIRAAVGSLVAAELGYSDTNKHYAVLRARTFGERGPWESFNYWWL